MGLATVPFAPFASAANGWNRSFLLPFLMTEEWVGDEHQNEKKDDAAEDKRIRGGTGRIECKRLGDKVPEHDCRTTNTHPVLSLVLSESASLNGRGNLLPLASAPTSPCSKDRSLSRSWNSERHQGKHSRMHESPSKYRSFCHQYRLDCDCESADLEEMKSSDPSPGCWKTGCWVQRSNIDQSVPDYQEFLFPPITSASPNHAAAGNVSAAVPGDWNIFSAPGNKIDPESKVCLKKHVTLPFPSASPSSSSPLFLLRPDFCSFIFYHST